MRQIVTLMVALGALSYGCGEDESVEGAESRALETVDAGATDTAGDASVVCAEDKEKSASAKIEPRSDNTTLAGTLSIRAEGGTKKLTIKVTGAPPGEHGAHIHAKGDCSAPDATSAGDHWNPTSAMHGAPSESSHLGDLGNLTVEADGTGELTLENDAWAIGDGSQNDVVGKAIVIHGGRDDLTSQPSGASGPRIGCGVITAD